MAVINGTLILTLVDGTPVGASKSCTLTISNATSPATNKGSGGWKQSILGERSWGVSGDGLYDPDGVFNFEQLYDMINARTADAIVEIAEIDGSGGGSVYRGIGLITQCVLGAPMEEVATYSFEIEGTGALAKGTVVSS